MQYDATKAFAMLSIFKLLPVTLTAAGIAGFSIPAAEHSTITSWGRAGELNAYKNMVKQFGKQGALVAVVSDAITNYNKVIHAHKGRNTKH